jgi:hypothetical protein
VRDWKNDNNKLKKKNMGRPNKERRQQLTKGRKKGKEKAAVNIHGANFFYSAKCAS